MEPTFQPLHNQQHLFQLSPDWHYLNCAYMSPLMIRVAEAGIRGIRQKMNPFQVSIQDFFGPVAAVKASFARLIGSDDAQRVAIVPSVSYGMAQVAANIRMEQGQKVVVAEGQFPSNIYPWKRIADRDGGRVEVVSAPTSDTRGQDWNAHLLEAIDSTTKAIALGHVHWADGTRFDLQAIRQKADQVGALLIIDGTQSVGALPFDVRTFRPDALVCAAYKWLMGPYSIGLAWYGEAFDGGTPIENNWINREGSEDFASLVNYQDAYQDKATRYDMGEKSNFILLPMLQAALDQVLTWTPAAVQDYCERLTAAPLQELQALGCRVEQPEWRGHHLFGIRMAEGNSPERMQQLKAALDQAKVHVSVRGDAVRISPHVYNIGADMEQLVKCVRMAVGSEK